MITAIRAIAWRWGAAALWALLLFRLSSQPAGTLEAPLPDYVLHFSSYAVLSALIWRACGGDRRGMVIAAVAGSVYGISDEFHQSFVPGRDPAVSDWVADTLGSAAAAALLYGLRARIDRRRTLLASAVLAIFALVPAVSMLRVGHPRLTSLAILAALAGLPGAGLWVLVRRGTRARPIVAILFVTAALQIAMYRMHLTFQEMLHLYEYGLVGGLFLMKPLAGREPTILGSLAFVTLAATVDESLQWLWPRRVGEVRDIIEDMIFGACGAAALCLIERTARRQRLSGRSLAACAIAVFALLVFVWQVHTGFDVGAGGLSYRSIGMDHPAWPPATVLRKEALAHVQLRNWLCEHGHLSEASAENLILERSYAQFLQGHRYSPEQRATLPKPPAHYRSPAPEWLYFSRPLQ